MRTNSEKTFTQNKHFLSELPALLQKYPILMAGLRMDALSVGCQNAPTRPVIFKLKRTIVENWFWIGDKLLRSCIARNKCKMDMRLFRLTVQITTFNEELAKEYSAEGIGFCLFS